MYTKCWCLIAKKCWKLIAIFCWKVLAVYSFGTVADEFGFTVENAPRFTAFATTEEKINWHLNGVHRPMYAYWEHGVIHG